MNAKSVPGCCLPLARRLASGSFMSRSGSSASGRGRSTGLVGGFFSWIIAPWILASLRPTICSRCSAQRRRAVSGGRISGARCGVWAADIWSDDALPGMSLGMGVALGYCAALDADAADLSREFLPRYWAPLPAGDSGGRGHLLARHRRRRMAGMSKERELSRNRSAPPSRV